MKTITTLAPPIPHKTTEQMEDWEIEREEEIQQAYKARIWQLKHLKKCIKQIPARELKNYGAYAYVIITDYPYQDNGNKYSYRIDAGTFCGDGFHLGDKCGYNFNKTELYRLIDEEIGMMK